jgi:predicted PurR-regulated permease PerM
MVQFLNESRESRDSVEATRLQNVRDVVLIGISLCAILYLGQEVIIPVAIATLLAVVLSPLVRRLQNIGVPKVAGVSVVVLSTFALLTAAGFLVATTLTQLAADLPRYEQNLRVKAQSIKSMTSGSKTLENAANVLEKLEREISAGEALSGGGAPVAVEITENRFGALQPVAQVLALLAHPLAQMAIMFLMLGFILYSREDLRNRFIRLVGTHDINKTTVALDEAGSRLSRLFRMQLAVNACAGCVVALALAALGVPGAALWGVLTAILRFAPYVGTFVASIFPIAIALAVGDGWTLGLVTAAFIFTLEFIVGHIVEPLVYGKSTGLSTFAIVLAAAFWTALWGPVGLLLSTPMTLGIMILGRHVNQLNALAILLGSDMPLAPETVFYQRLLAGDPAEAAEQAEVFLETGELADFIRQVAVPGLFLAHYDEQRRILTPQQAHTIRATFAEVLEELDDTPNADGQDAGVKLVAARGPLNEAATMAVSTYFTHSGVSNSVVEAKAQVPERAHAGAKRLNQVYICYLMAPSAAADAHIARRLKLRLNAAESTSIAWQHRGGQEKSTSNPVELVSTLKSKMTPRQKVDA